MVIKNYGVAIERWNSDHKDEVMRWLDENFGSIGINWDIDYDFDLVNLTMTKEVYITYLLKWSSY